MVRDYQTEFAAGLFLLVCPWRAMPSLDPPPAPEMHERDQHLEYRRAMEAKRASV